MKLIAGLGNPGSKYAGTRHNAGFRALNHLAEKYGIQVGENRFNGLIGRGVIEGEKVILVKPLTFMNNSGQCVRAAADYYRIAPEDIIIIYDDISLAPGQLRIRKNGSAGGHNGVKSLIAHLGGQDFARIRVGVGEKPEGWDLADYVLGVPSGAEKVSVDEGIEKAAEAAAYILKEGMDQAMNRYNRRTLTAEDTGGSNVQ